MFIIITRQEILYTKPNKCMISNNLTKSLISIVFLFIGINCFSQQFVISGFIEDKTSGEKLINAHIYTADKKHNVLSNNYGFYSLEIPAGETEIWFSYVGFSNQKIILNLSKDSTLNIRLEPNIQIDEVLITGSKVEKIGKIEINPAKLKGMPMIFGETDILKALQYYPGVQSGSEGRSGLYVRGGGPDQNLILLDGVPVYNVSHLFGFFSVFNPDAISSVKLYKSDVPARFGGSLSSVLDIQMKEGNNKEWHGDFTLGLIASKLTVEGPLKKDKSSIIFSVRRTYLDILMKPFLVAQKGQGNANIKAGYYFQDFNLKLNYKFNERNRIYLSAYTGTDKAYIDDESSLQGEFITNHDINSIKWGNLTTVLRWNYVFNNKLFANTNISYSRYKYQTSIDSKVITSIPAGVYTDNSLFNNFSGIESYAQNTQFDYFLNSKHHLQFGFGNTYFVFTPGSISYEQRSDMDSTLNSKVEHLNSNVYAYKLSLYVGDEINFKKLKLQIGAHYSGFNKKNTYYQNIEPRLAVEYSVNDHIVLYSSYTRMAQYIHLASNNSGGLPTDLWLPSTEIAKPETSTQYSIGMAISIKKDFRISLETYYKEMDKLLGYKEGAEYFSTTVNWENTITQGTGQAYGMELLFEKNSGKFTGLIGYTLAYSTRKFAELNKGKEFPYKYDRRHDISIVGNYKFNDHINIGAVWVYGTGNSITLPTQRYTSIDKMELFDLDNMGKDNLEYFGIKNNFKLPAYHRLDVSINMTKQKKKGIRTWSLGAYNVYNRQNPYLVYTKEVNGQKKLYQKSLFPVIPYFSYNYKF